VDAQTSDQLRRLEESLLDSSVRNSGEKVASLLTDDFVEFGSSGRIFNKALIIQSIGGETTVRRTVTDFTAALLGADIALVTYHLRRHEPSGDVCSLRSSIWQRFGKVWRMRFHQGTKSDRN
jgi:hypothetical protein